MQSRPWQLAILVLLSVSGQTVHGQFDPSKFAEQMRSQFNKGGIGNFANSSIRISPEELRRIQAVPISVREERAFGTSVLRRYTQQIRSNAKITFQGEDNAYILKLAMSLKEHMKNGERYEKFRVGLISTDQVDAFSIPGGTMLFTEGLLEEVKSEAAMIGVIAHEMSHLDRQHQLVGLRRQKLLDQSPSLSNLLGSISETIKPFHAEFELEADQDAVKWMLAESYDPLELSALWSGGNKSKDEQPHGRISCLSFCCRTLIVACEPAKSNNRSVA